MILRPIEPQDRSQVEALYGAELPQCPGLVDIILDEPSVFTLVAVVAEEVVGALSVALCSERWRPGAKLGGDLAEVLAIAVRPSMRRMGIGLRLMESAHAFADGSGAKRLEAQIREQPEAIHWLLAGLGWRPVEIEAETYADGQRAIRVAAEVGG